jgi:Fumarate reductase flavoprotein C-term
VEEEARRAVAPLGASGGGDLYALQAGLRDLMWERVGLIRDGPSLRAALAEIDTIGSRLARASVPGGPAFNLAWHDWLNLGSQVAAARLIAASALERAESRGAHRSRAARGVRGSGRRGSAPCVDGACRPHPLSTGVAGVGGSRHRRRGRGLMGGARSRVASRSIEAARSRPVDQGGRIGSRGAWGPR